MHQTGQASTADAEGADSDQLISQRLPCAQEVDLGPEEVATAARKNTRRMMRVEMMIPGEGS